MAKPPGLKTFRRFASPEEVAAIRARPELLENTDGALFRLYGAFGGKDAGEPADWMRRYGRRLMKKGLFAKEPNQYRVCDWIGDHAAVFKWHIDNRRHGERIFVLSLSDERALGFRPLSDRRAVYELNQQAGDAYLMGGSCRWSWEHRVLPRGPNRGGGQSLVVSYKRPR